jgi:hypothetical protein
MGGSEFLQSLNDPPFLSNPALPADSSAAQNTIDNAFSQAGNATASTSAAPIESNASASKKEVKSNGPSVPGSPINKCVDISR